jgi:hypothetical protein
MAGARSTPRRRWHPGVGAGGLLAASLVVAAAHLSGGSRAPGLTAWLLLGAAAGFAVSGST